MKPRLLDLFCGAGGAAMGYHRAGFEVVGVDIKPQPHYPFEFVQADAFKWMLARQEKAVRWGNGFGFDAIHASPPCQHYSTATRNASLHPDLYGRTRDFLQGIGLPYVIENVINAPYSHGIVLCGGAFGLEADGEWLKRHRNFETSWLLWQPPHPHRKDKRPITITGHCFLSVTKDCARHSRQSTFETAQRLMGYRLDD